MFLEKIYTGVSYLLKMHEGTLNSCLRFAKHNVEATKFVRWAFRVVSDIKKKFFLYTCRKSSCGPIFLSTLVVVLADAPLFCVCGV